MLEFHLVCFELLHAGLIHNSRSTFHHVSLFTSIIQDKLTASSVAPANSGNVDGYNYDAVDVKIAWKKVLGRRLRELILHTGRRSDGRGTEEVRPISIDTALLPGAHGSALFTRGETQSLSTATLGMMHCLL